MTPLATTPADILRFALDAPAGEAVLVTLVGIAGSSPRALGAQMVVRSDGDYRGSFSGGCIEAAIVGEARSILRAGESRIVRFGAGSPYIDIRLPCGGGIDLLFTPRPDPGAIAATLARLDARKPAAIRISAAGITAARSAATGGWSGDGFLRPFVPSLRIVAMGHGDALVATARLAHFLGADVRALSPASTDVAGLAAAGIAATPIDHRAPPPLRGDRWTAFALLFHDHEWEEVLLPWALRQPHLHVSAIGGAQSRRDRLRMLRGKGFDEPTLAHFRNPAGLIPATRDPATLALSVIAQIVAAYQADGAGAQKQAAETVGLYD
jgi:xanthine dehydrogenase accessory factor